MNSSSSTTPRSNAYAATPAASTLSPSTNSPPSASPTAPRSPPIKARPNATGGVPHSARRQNSRFSLRATSAREPLLADDARDIELSLGMAEGMRRIHPASWNAIANPSDAPYHPFLDWDFLEALE